MAARVVRRGIVSSYTHNEMLGKHSSLHWMTIENRLHRNRLRPQLRYDGSW